ncbi:photosystem II biosynthesis protein [Parathermosynechococcus lividus]
MAKGSGLPFESRKKSKATFSKAPSPDDTGRKSAAKQQKSVAAKQGAIPEVVSRRMVSRMAVCAGVPTLLGLTTFPVSYVIVQHHWFSLPHVVVVLVSLGWFGLGALGLSYGVISASWDEAQAGSWLGIAEFRTNFGRIVDSWQTRKSPKSGT